MPRSPASSPARSLTSRPAAPPATPSTATAPTETRVTILVAAVVLAIAAGIGLGAGATAYAVRLGTVGAVRAGPWRLLADAGTPDINPYLRAHYARTGEIPLVLSQGVTALADRDGAGAPLDRGCVYAFTGPMPPSLFWTLAAVDRHGAPSDNPAHRLVFGADAIVRDAEGAFTITLAPTVQPGNWLPLSGTGPFTLALRLYDTRLSEPAASGAQGFPMPRIERLRCG